MTFQELIQATGALLGLEGFQPDEDGFCTLESDEGVITIAYIPEAYGLVLLRVVVAEVPSEGAEAALRRALEANCGFRRTGGATLGVNPDTGCFELVRYYPLERLEPETLLALIEGFALALVDVRGHLMDDASSAPPPEDFRELEAHGFLRV